MAESDQFQKVGEDFKLHDEVLVVITDDDGEDEPVAVVFYRPVTGGKVEELEPSAVEEALAFATSKAAELGRQVVVQLDDQDIWWPRWGTLA